MSFIWPNFVFGTKFGDTLTGTAKSDFVFGFSGNDIISTGAGNDRIYGARGDDEIMSGAGDDWVLAGAGDDYVHTGAGNDTVFGGAGFDTSVYEGGIGDYTITQKWGRVTVSSSTTTDAGTDTLRQVEALYFKADDYTFYLDGTNNAVLAGDDAASTDEITVLTLSVADLLANDQEFDGDAITLTSVDATSAAGATVTLSGGSISYDPGTLFIGLAAGETATDTFTYIVDDGKGGIDTATVTITIEGLNTGPTLSADAAVTIDENTVIVPANVSATDPDSASITFSLAGADAGLFQIDATTGAISFITAPDFETPADADADNAYELEIIASDGDGGADSAALTVTVADVLELPEVDARINEVHYDNIGGDVGEFVEIRVAAGDDVSFLTIELVNGSDNMVYDSVAVAGLTMTSDGTYDYYVWSLPSNGIQNGASDGIVLANGPEVIEFLSYEGTLTAEDGAAAGMTSTDIGVSEASVDIGLSLQREDDGTWGEARAETPGAANILPPAQIVITEIMQNPSAVADSAGEWFEVYNAGDTAVDLNGWTVSDNDSDSFVIDNGGPLLIEAGAYLVFGNNGDIATNGGVAVDYAYSGMFLANGADELILTDTMTREIDRVEYDGGPAFPDPNGASMALIDPSLDNNDGANWTTADQPYGSGDLGTPGAANVAPPAPPVLVISEVMQNPSAVGDSSGEWFEIYNPGTEDIDINGWTISDDGSDSHVIDNGGPLIVPAGGYLVLGNNADIATNGGVSVDYSYGGGFFLANGADELVLTDPATGEVDRIEWDGGPVWPDPNGASMALIDPSLDNNDGTNWTTSDTPYGDGDFGTPGGANFDTTPVIVINEIMQNPAAVADSAGEWFEVYNAGTSTVDMNGWTVSDNDSDSFVIDNGGPLLVAPGEYLVFGNNGDIATNGGVAVDYAYSGMFLSNGADEIVLTAGDGTEIDRVEYDGGPAFPDPSGASMSLIDPSLDNSDGANWETATDTYGDGDLGTPGAANGDDDGGGATALLISEIQGAGTASAYVGQEVEVTAIVTHVLSNGFFLQEEDSDADADAATSEGIFVFTGSAPSAAMGDRVQVTGSVSEFFGETQIDSVTNLTVESSGNALPTAATVIFPVANTVLNSDGEYIADLEAYEGMRINLPQDFAVSDLFTLGRFADMGLHQGGVLEVFTQSKSPDAAAFAAYQDLAVRNTIVIDDGSSVQNPTVIPFEIDGVTGNIAGQYDAADPLSVGDTASNITGVVHYSRASGGSGDELYRIIPTETLVIEDTAPQEDEAPDVGGTITVSSFNVLNFFTTIDNGTATSGPGGLEPRGADDLTSSSTAQSVQAQTDALAEFERQADKMIAALAEIGADVFGLVEVENEFGDQNGDGQWAIQYIIDALNSEIPGAAYTFADPGTAFGDTGDAITVALIYDASTVEIAAGTTVEYLTDSDLAGLGLDFGNPVFDGSGTSRAPVAATFEELASGEQFTVSVNHFKSKGSVSPFGDNAGTGDGTGNNNEARTQAAIALDAWLDSNPTGTTDEDILIIGDLNAYAMEDPVQYLLDQGYENQIAEYLAADAFEYSFGFPIDLDTSPQVQAFGALDYALANGSLAGQVTGAAEWHINAGEASIRDYNLEFRPQEQADDLYSDDVFRASDHDPLIVGLNLGVDTALEIV